MPDGIDSDYVGRFLMAWGAVAICTFHLVRVLGAGRVSDSIIVRQGGGWWPRDSVTAVRVLAERAAQPLAYWAHVAGVAGLGLAAVAWNLHLMRIGMVFTLFMGALSLWSLYVVAHTGEMRDNRSDLIWASRATATFPGAWGAMLVLVALAGAASTAVAAYGLWGRDF